MSQQPPAPGYTYAAGLADIRAAGAYTARLAGHNLVLFAPQNDVFAVDNRCPHMGFPLHQGTLKDGILTCHWHHARFDLASGGTFDLWADDVTAFPTLVHEGEVWVDLRAPADTRPHQRRRLRDGLERNISLVIAKAVITLLAQGEEPAGPFRIGLDFGVTFRQMGWGQGLTILTCMANLLPVLDAEDRPRALYHGLAAVARDNEGMAPRFAVRALPNAGTDSATLKAWFRNFVEVRDADGAERCIVSALQAGADDRQMADMLFAAATDHRYIQTGHVLDFTNKALEALDWAGWEQAGTVLPSLASLYAGADRMEESNAWRNPVDLVVLLDKAFAALPAALDAGRARRGTWQGQEAAMPVLLADDPASIVGTLLDALRGGCSEVELAALVSYAAAMRIAQFHTSNEFGDWDTALHTFTFANAVEQGLRRSASAELLRGVFDAAMSVYLDRFLNVPAARLPGLTGPRDVPDTLLSGLPGLLDRQQQVGAAAAGVAHYLAADGDPDRLLAMLGKLLLREDRDFHTIQTVEAAVKQYGRLRGSASGTHVLIAAVRYLAAHSPTVRAQGQTYEIAARLSRGERVYEA